MNTKDMKINTVAVRMFMACTDRRPNAKMPVSAHQEIGKLLQILENVGYRRPGVRNRVSYVACALDDYLQCEYTSLDELPNDVFRIIYYGRPLDLELIVKKQISESSRDENIARLHKVQHLLKQHYPDCKPLNRLLEKLDKACESFLSWNATH